MNPLFVFLAGIFIRLLIPIGITVLIVYLLHRLDMRWQAEALEQSARGIEKIECWKIKDCAPEQYADCPAYASNQPCWQVHRLHNGYLREECLSCIVFHNAPIPAHNPSQLVKEMQP